jgi:enediyne polyketide synthase
MTDVAIVGTACRYPDADSPDELWRNVLAQRRAFRRLPVSRVRAEDYWSGDRGAPDRTYALQAAVLEGWEFDRVRFRISGRAFRAADLAHWLALEVAGDALAAAGHADAAGLDRERTAVLVGNTLTGEFSRASGLRLRWPYVRRVVGARLECEGWSTDDAARLLAALEADYKAPFDPPDEETLAGSLSNTIAGRICNAFDLKGGGYTVDGACASSLLAVANGCSLLAARDVDAVLAGGVDLSLDPFELVGFAKAGALAAHEMRVYDRRSEGFWPGEGCGFVVLRRLEDALRDARPILAVVRGWGISSDGAGGITRPELEGQRLALRRAYERTDFGIDSVELFEGHGTGTSVGDLTEVEALSEERREAGALRPAAIGSVKANIGHTKAAAGIAGLLKAALSLREQVIPPTTGCVEPLAALSPHDGALRAVRAAEPWPRRTPVRAGVSAMGFGGINAHVVLEAAPAPRRLRLPSEVRRLSASAQDAELFVVGAPTGAALAVRARSLLAEAGALSLAELGDLASVLASGVPGEAVRAAVVAATPDELERGLESVVEVASGVERTVVDSERGIAVGHGGSPRVGLLFPGQGSPASRDGGALGRRFPFTREALAGACLPTDDLVETAAAQPAIVAGSLGALRLLEHLGVEATIAVGHSLGELTALCWAGAVDEAATVYLAVARGRAMSQLAERNGAMASLAADAHGAERLAEGTGAVVAGLNGPRQTVVSGTEDAIAAVQVRAEAAGVAVIRLPVSHAFHSPLIAPAVPRFAEALRETTFHPLVRPVVSTITGARLDGDEDLRSLLVRQMTEPVHFAAALEEAARTVDVFVEVGPGRVLSRLVGDSVAVPAVATDAGGPSLRPTLFAIGTLWALGAPLGPERLFWDRFTRPFVLGAPRRFLANPCEAAPLPAAPAAAEPPPARAENADIAVDGSADPVELVRSLVAARTELPVEAIEGESRLLSDLHLNSIVVAEIASEAARALGLTPPSGPSEFANATIAELAAGLQLGAVAGEEREVPRGVATWLRTFETVLVERPPPPGPRIATSWDVVTEPGHPLAEALATAFAGGGEHDGVLLALPPDADERCLPVLVKSLRTLYERRAGRFALLQHGCGAASLARVLQLEEPAIDVCVIDLPLDAAALDTARAEAESAFGYREVVIDEHGVRRVPVLRRLDLTPGSLPLDAGDVLVVTGGGKGIGAECALALARAGGLSVGLVGRSDPRSSPELERNLERFDAAGIRHAYIAADITDAAATRAAVETVEARLGPVRGVLHAAGSNAPALLAALDEAAFRATLAPKVGGLRNVLAAVDEPRLQVVVTFGSIIGRIGVRGEGHYALASEWLGAQLDELAKRLPECRCVQVDWSVWAGLGMGERLGTVESLARSGVDAIPVDEGVRLLEQLVRTPKLPSSVVASGRFGLPQTVELERTEARPLRFLERPRLEYPGVELVVDVDLSAGNDPYLDDHAIDGVPVLPAVLSLEAVAQAATALAGRPPTALEHVAFLRPITLPRDGGRRVRVAGLRGDDSTVETAIRSDDTGFEADHVRASCRIADPGRAAETLGTSDVGPELLADDLYGDLFFQGRRFRRVQRYELLRARRCRAVIERRPDEDWFGPYLPQGLVLGDPGARDACIHALQACIPHVRVVPVAVERITVEAAGGAGLLRVAGRERRDDGEQLVWDLEVRDEAGILRESWTGLVLQRLAPAPVLRRWPPPLLAVYFERRLAELVGEQVGVTLRQRSGLRAPGAAAMAMAEAAGLPGPVRYRADGKPELDGMHVSGAHADGYALGFAAGVPLACDVEAVEPRTEALWRDLLGDVGLGLARHLGADLPEALDASAARVWAAAECVRKNGRPRREPLVLDDVLPDGWALLRAGRSPVATYVTRLAEHRAPLAFAFLVEADR